MALPVSNFNELQDHIECLISVRSFYLFKFILANTSYGTNPVIRKIFERCFRGDIPPGSPSVESYI